jgi:hypothetical protein
MKKYGMILADNSGNKNIWSLSAVQDSRWDLDSRTFTGIHGSDFEAVDESSLMIDKDSGKAQVTPEVSSTLTPAKTPTPEPTGGQSDLPNNGIVEMAIAFACIGIMAICIYKGLLEK